MTEGKRAISGAELQTMSDEALKQSLRTIGIYARVSAAHKLRIVRMVRSQYHIGLFSNRWMVGALASSLGAQLMVIYLPPLQKIFGTVELGFLEWGVIATATLIVGASHLMLGRFFRRMRWFVYSFSL